MNRKETKEPFVSLRLYAEEHKVPIITYEGLQFLLQIIRMNRVKRVLEIGTAIGYSSLAMAMLEGVEVLTIERNIDMYEQAIKNIEAAKMQDQIQVIKADALEVDETKLGNFDLIFIDAAKAQSIKFFEKYESQLNDKGIIVTDNLLFHGLVVKEIRDRNLRQLITKIDRFNRFVVEKEGYNTVVYHIGDGMSVSIKE